MQPQLDFFFFIGSTYTYLSVSRVGEIARRGISLRWRPFSVRVIMREQNNIPFDGKPVKLRYMGRDVERRAGRYGIPFASIPAYPVDPDELANRVAVVASREGWCSEFTRAAYNAWFIDNKMPGDLESTRNLLSDLDKNPDATIDRANSGEIRDAYPKATDAARRLGIFGSPTFTCGSEIFWGDDRFEDAVDWAIARRD